MWDAARSEKQPHAHSAYPLRRLHGQRQERTAQAAAYAGAPQGRGGLHGAREGGAQA